MIEKRNRKIIILLQSVLILLSIVVFLFAVVIYVKNNPQVPMDEAGETQSSSLAAKEYAYSTPNSRSSQESTVSTEEEAMAHAESVESEQPVYIVCAYHDKVTVFIQNHTQPYMQLSVRVSALPEEDQILLAQGIRANSEAELVRILEDYDG